MLTSSKTIEKDTGITRDTHPPSKKKNIDPAGEELPLLLLCCRRDCKAGLDDWTSLGRRGTGDHPQCQ